MEYVETTLLTVVLFGTVFCCWVAVQRRNGRRE